MNNDTAFVTTQLAARHHWVFDMDGTLTIAMHDFDAMRAELGITAGMPILEALKAMPEAQARKTHQALDAMELRMAADAREQPGASALLTGLSARGARLGIVTRNGKDIAHATLEACGLAEFFDDDDVISRDCAPAKPDPGGIHHLLERWSASPRTAVMVGDYLFDLEAGQRADCMTVHVNVNSGPTWPEHTDRIVRSLDELTAIAVSG